MSTIRTTLARFGWVFFAVAALFVLAADSLTSGQPLLSLRTGALALLGVACGLAAGFAIRRARRAIEQQR